MWTVKLTMVSDLDGLTIERDVHYRYSIKNDALKAMEFLVSQMAFCDEKTIVSISFEVPVPACGKEAPVEWKE